MAEEKPNTESPAAGEKHQTDHDAPDAKRAKTEKQQSTKKQQSIEESMGAASGGDASDDKTDASKQESREEDTEAKDTSDESSAKANGKANGADAKDGDTAEKPHSEKNVPSNILEKGIIYFFIRGRVNIEDPESVSDIQRSFMILRPLGTDSKLGDGPIGDAGTTRLIALPKKTFPESGKDRFMTFVEKAHTSFEELKKEFLSGADYETKTAGTRHTPAATPIGEGVYAMTSTGRESHLAYMLTLPEKPDEVQQKLGIKEQGSWILSTKNPKYPGPANAQLAEDPGFSKEIIDEFRSLRWSPTQPKHLDYPNAQMLLIGESSGIDKAVEPQEDDKKKPEEVLEELEDEDTKRMQHLAKDDSEAIFKDLTARSQDYPKLQTTF